jgi:NAD kinase
MKFALVAREKKAEKEIASLLKKRGHTISQTPDLVVSIGGDGTFLLAERKYPGVPKLQVRKDSICKTCVVEADHFEHLLPLLEKGKYYIESVPLVEASVGKKKLVALNEVQIHNDVPVQAIRFSLDINGRIFNNRIVADGLVVATPFGSTAYYYSVGGEPFKKGFGVGFNNPHTRMKSFVVSDSSRIVAKLIRGPSTLYADNILEGIKVKEGQSVIIKKSEKVAKIVKIK